MLEQRDDFLTLSYHCTKLLTDDANCTKKRSKSPDDQHRGRQPQSKRQFHQSVLVNFVNVQFVNNKPQPKTYEYLVSNLFMILNKTTPINLHHVSGVRGVVIRIRSVIIHLNDRQPVNNGLFVAAQHTVCVKLSHDLQTEVYERSLLCQLLQLEYIKLPTQRRIEQILELRRCL